MNTIEQNKAVVRRLYEVFNGGDLEAFHDIVAADFLNHEAKDQPEANRQRGPEGIANVVRWIRGAMTDLHYEELAVVAEGDLVAVYVTASGSHTGVYRGRTGTGARFTRSQMHFYRLEDGRISEHWATRDDLGAFIQLGFLDSDLRRPE